MKKNENVAKKQFFFTIINEKGKYIKFPENITVSEMIKATFSKLLLNPYNSRIVGLSPFDKSKINKFQDFVHFTIYKADPFDNHWIFGKKGTARIIDNNKNRLIIFIGILNSISKLIQVIEKDYCKKLIKLYIGKMEFGKNDIKSLKSIGINEDFDCKVELDNNSI